MGEEISTEDAEKTLTAEELLKKIKSNQPEDLTSENDYLNTIPKGDMIKAFLESLLNRPVVKDKPDIQMIALYGEWGSGKTSLMKYIQSQLGDGSFKTVFFESWLLEKDNDLALSLLESVLSEHKGAEIRESMISAFLAVSKGVLSGLSINTPIFKFDFDKLQKEIGAYLKDHSFKERINSFKDEYRHLEDEILSGNQRLIVFVDDLDRCEPENVLNLLSAIKLFFTFGNRTIFICGLDKAAVDEAVKVKYKDIVKSGEYMEKIFDISFNMPQPDLGKMIHYYFEGDSHISGVKDFFEEMHFTNPRHLKKVLNQYLLLRYYQASKIDEVSEYRIPNQKIDFFKYLTLFIIMLYKFEPENFQILKDYEGKLKYYKNNKLDLKVVENENDDDDDLTSVILKKSNSLIKILENDGKCTLNDIYKYLPNKMDGELKKICFSIKIITLFAPRIKGYIYPYKVNKNAYLEQFSKMESLNLPAYFCRYLTYGTDTIPKDNTDYEIWDIFEMAELYL